jgi:hypothetical protein
MALDEAQILKIARMLTTSARILTYEEVNEQVTYIGDRLTATVETQVEGLLTEWEASSTNRDTTVVRARDRNFGAELDPDKLRNILRREMAALLYFTDLSFGGSNWGYSARS